MQCTRIWFVLGPVTRILAGMDNDMPRTFGTSLRSFMRDKQAAVAQHWLELWEQRLGAAPEWKPETISSHLSRALNDKGLTFFSCDAARLEVLFDAAVVPEAERPELRRLAVQAAREPAPRLVVDMSSWPDGRDATDVLCRQLDEQVLAGQKLAPVALVLTARQFDWLPRSFDDRVETHRVQDADEGAAKARELAGETALVLAPWQHEPLERWLAAHFDGKALALAPAGALAAFAADDRLPGAPEVVYPLADITAPSDTKFKVQELTPTVRRHWIVALADEAALAPLLPGTAAFKTPGDRLAFAQQLGAQATSLASERLAHELAQLTAAVAASTGLTVETLDEGTHRQRLVRAGQRPAAPAVWRVGDEIHLLGVTPPHSHPRYVVHTPSPPEPAISRLLAHLEGWTEDDYDADPSLLHAVAELAGDGPREVLLHARATILWNELSPEPDPAAAVKDWESALRELFAVPVPTTSRKSLPRPASRFVV